MLNTFLTLGNEFSEAPITLGLGEGELHGTLTMPTGSGICPVALIIAGSGPTDRDGNNPMMKNNALKMLAWSLAAQGIATVRYDKRGIAASQAAGSDEAELRFEHYVHDAAKWVDLLKSDIRFSSVAIIGHSEGSLIGMMAAQAADAFVSLAGAGQSADQILKQQLSSQPEAVKALCFPIIEQLKNGQTVSEVSPMLASLFRPSVQPYLISWFRHDPVELLPQLSIPVLIVQGQRDLQVSVSDAKRLHAAQPQAKLVLIDEMNHILKLAPADPQENMATYNQPSLPLAEGLVEQLVAFLKP